jgi:hypothetical protein
MKQSVCKKCKELDFQKFTSEGVVQVIFFCRKAYGEWDTVEDIKNSYHKTIITIGVLNDDLGLDGTADYNEDFQVPEECPYITEHTVDA